MITVDKFHISVANHLESDSTERIQNIKLLLKTTKSILISTSASAISDFFELTFGGVFPLSLLAVHIDSVVRKIILKKVKTETHANRLLGI